MSYINPTLLVKSMGCYQRYSPYAVYFKEFAQELNNFEHDLNIQFKEEDDKYVVYLDLPGFSKDQVVVDIVDMELKVEATKEEKKIEKSFKLPKQVDREHVTAKMENGVLEIVLAKIPKFVSSIEIQ